MCYFPFCFCSCFYYCLCNALLFSTIRFFFCHLQWYQWYWLNLLLWDLIITSKKLSTYQIHCKIRQFHLHALSLVKAGLFGMVSYWALFFDFFKGRCWSWVLHCLNFVVWYFPFPILYPFLPFLSPIHYFVLLFDCIVVEWKVWKYWIWLIHPISMDLEPYSSPFIPLLWLTDCNFPFSYTGLMLLPPSEQRTVGRYIFY